MRSLSRRNLLRAGVGAFGTALVTRFGWERPALAAQHNDALVLLEAESFSSLGGWVIDQEFAGQMGSAFLLAHGMGQPVGDAGTVATIPSSGSYRVWVRTRDWVAPWNAPGAPGRFELKVDGHTLPVQFGTEGAKWHWQDGGKVDLHKGKAAVALHDLTGFEGRCDAILFAADPAFRPPDDGADLSSLRKKALRLPDSPVDAGLFDLVVAGGGMAGAAAAVSAARLGLKVALIQDRPVCGGNASSEVRVALGGEIHLPPYPALGAIVAEMDPGHKGNAGPAANYDDDKKLAVLRAERNLQLFLDTRVFSVEKSGDEITALLARDIKTSREMRFRGSFFADCTGDGSVGFLAGAEYRYGRESHASTGESLAPPVADRFVNGSSVMWYSEDAGAAVPFPETPWALAFNEESVQNAKRGDWNWETGQNRDQIAEFESIRDSAFRAIYGNWSFQKNHSSNKAEFANLRLGWVGYIGGKRESRRLMGDVVLEEQDIMEQRAFPDASVSASWPIDLHEPQPKNAEQFPGQEFRTICKTQKKPPYAIPYRCFYSRNIENLFMAGRNISVTHVALGTVRVMRTTGMMGEVVGMAAAIASKHGCTPRGVYKQYLPELQAAMTRGVGKTTTAPA